MVYFWGTVIHTVSELLTQSKSNFYSVGEAVFKQTSKQTMVYRVESLSFSKYPKHSGIKQAMEAN